MHSTKTGYSLKAKVSLYTPGIIKSNRLSSLKKLSTKSNYFDQYYLDELHNIYRENTTSPCYTFSNSVVFEINEMIQSSNARTELSVMKECISYYAVYDKYLFEFTVRKTIAGTNELYIKRSDFSSTASTIESELCVMELEDSDPSILLVGNQVIVSKPHSFGEHDKIWKLTSLYNAKSTSIVYNLSTNKPYVFAGTVDFNVCYSRFIVVFRGSNFAVIDIEACREIYSMESGMDVTYIETANVYGEVTHYLDKVTVNCILITTKINELSSMNTDELPSSNTAIPTTHISKIEYDSVSEERIETIHDIELSGKYVPLENECATCYKMINFDYVQVPCGHRIYCADCIKDAVSEKKCCGKCEVVPTEYVAIADC